MSQGDRWRLENGGPLAEYGISAPAPAQYDETWIAAYVLQAMGQDHQR